MTTSRQQSAEMAGMWPKLHEVLGLRLEQDGGEDTPSRVVLPLTEAARGAVAPLHGGVIATIIDVACASAIDPASYEFNKSIPVSVDLSVKFFRQPKASPVVAEGRVIHLGSKLIQVECDVKDGDGRLIAHGGGAYMLVEGFGKPH